jgi:lipopolysaccharide biosynthesis regulator YciM
VDPTLSQILWATLLGMAVGAILGVVFAAMGKKRQQERAATRAYLTSFRYVLSDDPDAAIEELTRVAGITPEATETYFALGQLLRRKGDLARAIRIHQNLILHPDLPAEAKRAAAFELARDYRASGLFGRGVEVLEKAIALEPRSTEALRELRQLAEESGDWERAIDAEERLAALGAGDPSILAHLRAARARALLAAGDGEGAAAAAAAALAACPTSADARAAHGEVLLARGEVDPAIAALTAAFDADPDALSLVFGTLEEAFARHDRAQARTEGAGSPTGGTGAAAGATGAGGGLRGTAGHAGDAGEGGNGPAAAGRRPVSGLGVLLGERLKHRPDDPFLGLALARHLRRRGLSAEAARLLRQVLTADPGLLEARRELGEILLAEGTAEELRGELAALLAELESPLRPFSCKKCGLELSAYAFRCPRCLAWDAVERRPGSGRERPPEAA